MQLVDLSPAKPDGYTSGFHPEIKTRGPAAALPDYASLHTAYGNYRSGWAVPDFLALE